MSKPFTIGSSSSGSSKELKGDKSPTGSSKFSIPSANKSVNPGDSLASKKSSKTKKSLSFKEKNRFSVEPQIKSHLTEEDLVSGFGFHHTHASLDSVLKKLKLGEHKRVSYSLEEEGEESEPCSTFSTSKLSNLTEVTEKSSAGQESMQEQKLHYLMKLKELEIEEEEVEGIAQISAEKETGKSESSTSSTVGETESMRQAQLYLHNHKIFGFFQFLIAHLLSARPYDPIEFLLTLLDKCLFYRSGVSPPPLLYENSHIECLFNMMDRMRTGYIDLEQYHNGLFTLGIHIPRNATVQLEIIDNEDVISKATFVNQANNLLRCLLDDMLRPWPEQKKKKCLKMPKAPPPTVYEMSLHG